jgi:hypothetical protein
MHLTKLPANTDAAAAELLRQAAHKEARATLDAQIARLQPSAETQVLRARIKQFLHDKSASVRGASQMSEYFCGKFTNEKMVKQ